MKTFLNLGCGHRLHSTWTNIDFVSKSDGVIAHNLTQGIPFPDASFNVVYHSHVLEHFPKTLAMPFLRECYRVLRPAGVLRVVVPDLEQIVRTYITALEKASSGVQDWVDNYEWILLEMYDQTVRNRSGGEMITYLLGEAISNEEFVMERCGTEAKNLIASGNQYRQSQSAIKIENKSKHLLKQIYRFLRYPSHRRELLLKNLLGKEYSALQTGRFRQGGEVHQWMYDRYSLSVLLKKCGLINIAQRSAADSYIPDWTQFNLDTEPDGQVYKPDSLFMEAIKPAA